MKALVTLAALAATSLALTTQASAPIETSGGTALALAVEVAAASPLLTRSQKSTAAQAYSGQRHRSFPSRYPVTVVADDITCRMSDVAIGEFSCDLAFGGTHVALSDRAAHELRATLLEAGATGEGAAGTIYVEVTGLRCVLKPAELADNAGGGADCSFSGSGGASA